MNKNNKKSGKLTCQWCDKSFVSEYNLKIHLKSAKYCLKIRGETEDVVEINIKCEYCDSLFTQKTSLKTHHKTCKKRIKFLRLKKESKSKKEQDEKIVKMKNKHKVQLNEEKNKFEIIINEKKQQINEEKNKFELIINEQKQQINEEKNEKCKLQIIIKEQNDIINKLKEDLAREEGRVMGLETAKPSTVNNKITTNYSSPKLSMVNIDNIRPLTINTVQQDLYKYTREEFFRGIDGITDFMENLTTFPPPKQIKNFLIDQYYIDNETIDTIKKATKSFRPKSQQNIIDTNIKECSFKSGCDIITKNISDIMSIEFISYNVKALIDPNATSVTCSTTTGIITSTTSTTNTTSTSTTSTTNTTSTSTTSTAMTTSQSNPLLTSDELERKQLNYACTDANRYAFHKLGEKKIWSLDAEGNFICAILDEMQPKVNEYITDLRYMIEECMNLLKKNSDWKKYLEEHAHPKMDFRLVYEGACNHEKDIILRMQERYKNISERVDPIYTGINYDEDRKALFKEIRIKVRSFTSI